MKLLALTLVLLGADADPLKPAKTAFGEGDADACLKLLQVVLDKPGDARLLGRAYLLRAQCINLKDGPSRASKALEDALLADPELVIDASRVDPHLVGLLEGVRLRLRADVSITSDKLDTVVTLDGADIGEAPLSLKVVPGRHRFVARTRDGRFVKEKELLVYPKRSYELALDLAPARVEPVAAPPPPPVVVAPAPPAVAQAPVETAAAPEASWVHGLFVDGRVLGDPGRGVGFEFGAGWSARHFVVSASVLAGGYLGGGLRLGGRLPLAGGLVQLGLGAQAAFFGVPGTGGGVAAGVGGNGSVALHWRFLEVFAEGGVLALVAVPPAAESVPRVSPLVVGGLRFFVP